MTINTIDSIARRALLVGITYEDLQAKLSETYPNENFRLPGTHKDPLRIKKLLVDLYNYKEEDITILMDDNSGNYKKPTRDNMVAHMKSLVENVKPGDHLVFCFSGHGSQIVNTNNTEEDGFDEVIWPCDVSYDPSKEDEHERAENFIQDDDLKKILVDNLPDNSRLTVVLDNCHSGTGLDLPFHDESDSFDKHWFTPTSERINSLPFSESNQYDLSSTDAVVSSASGDQRRPSDDLMNKAQNRSRNSSLDDVRGNMKDNQRSNSSNITLIDQTDSSPVIPSRLSSKGSHTGLRTRRRTSTMGMKMPHKTQGYHKKGSSIFEEGTQFVTEPIDIHSTVSKSNAYVTQWSACMDGQLGIDSNEGGLLTLAFCKILRENPERTNGEMLEAISKDLFEQGKEAKKFFRDNNILNGNELPHSKPSLSSLRPIKDIKDHRAPKTVNTTYIGSRRALLVGITYKDLQDKLSETYPDVKESFELPGAHKDPLTIRKLLIDLYNYKEEDITILMDDNSGNYKKPTRDNMVAHMKNLVENVKPGDHLVFCFSGHGSQIVNTNNTEEDGFDEVIWPCDVSYDPSKENEHERAENFIQDDDLKKILVDNLPDNSRLTVVLDNCHSGTGLDLPFNQESDNPDKKWLTPSSERADSLSFSESNQYNLPSTDAVVNSASGNQRIPSDDLMVNKAKDYPRDLSLDNIRRNMKDGQRSNPADYRKADQKDKSLVMPSRLAPKDSHRGARTRRRTSTMGMKMPHKTQGYHKKGSAILEEGTQFGEESIQIHSTVPKSNAYVTSWAACMDDQLGIDSDQGGSLTLALDKILRECPKRTNGDMLKALSKELLKQREEAEEYFRVNNIPTGNNSPQPEPSLGSLRPIEDIIGHKFTF
ncbi:peptidase C14 [Pyrrhoderma noxium]|uniref:Peptidase C14 n=1 Tax=Pyrrhoderma noxium TaxID=2282107 RepID=A0A286U754_9AGAM|nr:peptidase C14 [Pyrrhoderma noxium]